ncbi:MAG: FG-GAP-like repeat-containing protein [Hyphomonadaceae bacterium]
MGTWTPGPGATPGDDIYVGDNTDEIVEGLGGNDTLSAVGGTDTLDGGEGNDTLISGAGIDVLIGGEGNDELRVFGSHAAASGETFSGGNGTDTIVMAGSFDFSTDTVTSIERLVFGFETNLETSLVATFNAGNLPITNVTGTSAADRIVILADENNGGADLQSWVFTNWSADDQVVFISGDGDDDFVGHSGTDIMIANGLFDSVDGRAGDDYIASAGNVHQSLIGGSGFNTLVILRGLLIDDSESEFDGYYRSSFTGMQMGGIHAIDFGAPVGIENDLGVDKIFEVGSAQIESGAVSLVLQVRGVEGQSNVVEVTMTGIGNVGLGSWTFNDWNPNGSSANASERDLIVIRGNDNPNSLGGSTQVDWIFAGGSNDFIYGDAGDDLIDGGQGRDTATIDDSSSIATWHRTLAGGWTVNSADGLDTLTGIEILRFGDRDVWLDAAFRTFSGDGTSDILWRRADGLTATWTVLGTAQSGSSLLGSVGNEWRIEGTGDFDGDGRDDIVWQRNDGLLYLWNQGSISAAGFVAAASTAWEIQGIGDFNIDGRDDFVWRNQSTGQVAIWTMNGFSTGTQTVIGSAGAEWSIVGNADLNSNGRDEILWRRDDGLLAVWETNGFSQTSATVIASVGTEWDLVGTGDFNGDGRGDLLWLRDDGLVSIWHMNGPSQLGAAVIGGVGTTWNVENVGDYDGDGRDDILWRNDSGLVAIWTIDGFSITGTGVLGSVG